MWAQTKYNQVVHSRKSFRVQISANEQDCVGASREILKNNTFISSTP